MERKKNKLILAALAAASFAFSLSSPMTCQAATGDAVRPVFNLLANPFVGTAIDILAPSIGSVAKTIGSVDLASLAPNLAVEPAGLARSDVAKFQPVRPTPPTNAPMGDSVFGTVAIPFKHLAALDKLAGPLAEIRSGKSLDCGAKGCDAAESAVAAAEKKVAGASIRDKINTINYTVNHAIRYATDMETYHETDHWAKPSEALSRQQGDCEDYAILKMAALYNAGVDLDQMALVVLFDQKRHFYHAVLSVSVNGNNLILDNMRDEVLSDKRIAEYLPLYSIVAGRGYLHGSRDPHAQALAAAMPLTKVAPGEGELH
ncbi:transglutaminase-like cysteine peptidase [Rhizobium lusitanum]|uniref:Putative transglutaminase-like cysteine proteinase n=1 Tax=Rhizobium lusitanum TaxID=293958 RepID=A0A7X0IZH9_9HYPH|nr:transglutaminase-like cysteine peptidase [Rhizobium lusitanum]MBB6488792.1 putative transglutaminase-like cysteine proteinase [Rhizobium lusitanum]